MMQIFQKIYYITAIINCYYQNLIWVLSYGLITFQYSSQSYINSLRTALFKVPNWLFNIQSP